MNPCHCDGTGGASRAFTADFPVDLRKQRHHGSAIGLGVAIKKLTQSVDGQVTGPVPFCHRRDPITDSKNTASIGYSAGSNWVI
jgi:hypothetical protein